MAISKGKAPRKVVQCLMPSRAYKYREAFPDGKIGVKSFNFDVEQILAGEEDGQQKMNLITPLVLDLPAGFPVGSLLVADQLYLLMAARAQSFGVGYEFSTTCSHCGKVEEHSYDIPDGLPINVLPEGFEEPMEVTLPTSKDKVGLRFLTLDDDNQIALYAKQRKATHKDAGDTGYKYRFAKQIVEVNGNKPDNIQDAIDYVEALDGRDPGALRAFIEKSTPGLNPLLKIQCPNGSCGQTYDAVFRITASFFRPT